MIIQNEEELAHQVIGNAIEIHKNLGPGLNKENYIEALKIEFQQEDIDYDYDVEFEIAYKDIVLKHPSVVDFLVFDQLVIQIIAADEIPESEIQRILKVIRNNDYKLGLIINFNSTLLKNGIRRVSNHKN
ncbi:MAG: GxxExxY protein [Bacteroidia bacterium]